MEKLVEIGRHMSPYLPTVLMVCVVNTKLEPVAQPRGREVQHLPSPQKKTFLATPPTVESISYFLIAAYQGRQQLSFSWLINLTFNQCFLRSKKGPLK